MGLFLFDICREINIRWTNKIHSRYTATIHEEAPRSTLLYEDWLDNLNKTSVETLSS